MANAIMQRIDTAAQALSQCIGKTPAVGLILGSGLGGYAETLTDAVKVSYASLPGFPTSTAPGHEGCWVAGDAEGVRVLCMRGRFHGYEGWQPEDVALPIRVMARMGIGALIVTNAAGGVNVGYKPGDLMLIADHLNFAGVNPLVGPNLDELGPRFPDMSEAYSRSLRQTAKGIAASHGMTLHEGVYAMMSGPSYETPAEIRMLRALGADAVGMSTVPEVIAARHAGVKVLGISCITNCAAGILDQPLTHEEVMETGKRAQGDMTRLVSAVIKTLA